MKLSYRGLNVTQGISKYVPASKKRRTASVTQRADLIRVTCHFSYNRPLYCTLCTGVLLRAYKAIAGNDRPQEVARRQGWLCIWSWTLTLYFPFLL